MKTYHGMRTDAGCTVVVEEDGEFTGLDYRQDLHDYSSDIDWGYGGSGPTQLALALAADVLGDDDKAQAVYQRLKARLICGLRHEGWVLTERRIRSAIEAIEQERGRPR
jgi:hypothetical protein